MSDVKGKRCDQCGAVGEDPSGVVGLPAGWYSVWGAFPASIIPRLKGPYHFCSLSCLGKAINQPYIQQPCSWWHKLLEWWRK